MTIKDKSIREIQDLEKSRLHVYLALPTHTPEADKRMIKTNSSFIDFLYKMGLIKDGAKVLDIGCGTGWFVEMFRRKGFEVYGGDILPTEVMYERYPQGKFLYFDIFSPPQDPRKYDFIFIRSLGPIDKVHDWRGLTLFSWIGDHLNKEGVLYFVHNSNGTGIPDEERCHHTASDVIHILKRDVGDVLYCNRLPNNMTFVVRKGTVNPSVNHSTSSNGYILNLWNGPQKSPLLWLIHGMPVLLIPADDLWILMPERKHFKLFDYFLLFRSYFLRTIKYMIKYDFLGMNNSHSRKVNDGLQHPVEGNS